MASLIFRELSFSYPGSPVDLFQSIDFGVSEGWVGVMGSNGAGKTTLLQLACGLLSPQEGRIHRPAGIVYCPQRTDEPMLEFADFLAATDGEAYRIRGELGVEDDYLGRWHTLSHGERKRSQIATCLYLAPDLLAVDEPTNHLDTEARLKVQEALRRFRGIGLLVSHDRTLLDTLCAHSLFVSPPSVVLRSGGYTTAMKELDQEAERSREARTAARKERRRLEHEAVVRREHLRKAEKKKSLRGVNPRDNDARAKARTARVADSGVRKRVRQIDGRVRRVKESERSIDVTARRSLGIGIHGRASNRNTLFMISAGSLPLGEHRALRFPDLLMQPRDRIALTGPNGAGKSTLLRHLEAQISMPENDVVWIPQETSALDSAKTLQQVRTLAGQELGDVMKWVSLLGSDPGQLLDSELPSPGEIRKLMLALRLEDTPSLVVMDEPTNHMDLLSIECLESALQEYPGGLLLVSHDQTFLSRLTTIRWAIECLDTNDCRLIIHSHWDLNMNLSQAVAH
ncbi:ABC-F family ATP-binding cassette domain-containing protein [Candidatus Bipolaricaulota bacterium]|nr:ABC-F family ATP-binding cassette domain-containing protein [Candidatus Bipolaricaulota bacterium]